MTDAIRSGCPINLSLEVIGDRWSLLVIRDIIFGNRRHFRELLTRSEEGISSNILADRLKTLMEQGILTRADDPTRIRNSTCAGRSTPAGRNPRQPQQPTHRRCRFPCQHWPKAGRTRCGRKSCNRI